MKSITRPETHADLLLAQAVDTLVSTYQQTKTASDGFGIVDRARACRIIAQRAMALSRRGWPWRYNTAGAATVPQL